jgi:hypothetical protein
MSDSVMLPQTVFAGDEARLIVAMPLNSFAGKRSPIIVTDMDKLPYTDDIIITRVEVNFNTQEFIVDFKAFNVGELPLPEIRVENFTGPSNLTVKITPLLELEGFTTAALSPPAPPLAAPGTFALIIGSTALLIALITAVVVTALRGPAYIRAALEAARVRHLIKKHKRSVVKTLKLLTAGGLDGKTSLAQTNSALKTFLGALYRTNCTSFSAHDFLNDNRFTNEGGLFAECDHLRFKARPVSSEEAAALARKTLAAIVKYG